MVKANQNTICHNFSIIEKPQLIKQSEVYEKKGNALAVFFKKIGYC